MSNEQNLSVTFKFTLDQFTFNSVTLKIKINIKDFSNRSGQVLIYWCISAHSTQGKEGIDLLEKQVSMNV